MIGQMLLTAPLLALLLYAWSESKLSRVVGTSISAVTLVVLALVWFPEEADVVAETLQLGTSADLVMYASIGLISLVLLNLHLKNRRQMQIVTALARHIAIAGGQTAQDRIAHEEPSQALRRVPDTRPGPGSSRPHALEHQPIADRKRPTTPAQP